MPSTIITPPQGNTKRALLGIGHFYRIFFTPPQGIGGVIPSVSNAWINDLGEQFTDDLGNVLVFAP